MDKITLRACAKINLYLDYNQKLQSGYHDMFSVMQTLALYDSVSITKTKHPGIKIFTSSIDIPTDENNTAYCAAKAFLDYMGIAHGVVIEIEKRIPVCAGLGGGSADASAVLRGCNLLFETKLSMEQLLSLAITVGSDVPFGMIGGTCLVQGVGEKVTPMNMVPNCSVALVKPTCRIDTGNAYGWLDEDNMYLTSENNRENHFMMITDGIKNKDIKQVMAGCYNRFFDTIINRTSNLKDYYAIFGEHELSGMLSGSGPTLFALTNRWDKAERVKAFALSMGAYSVVTNLASSDYALYYNIQ